MVDKERVGEGARDVRVTDKVELRGGHYVQGMQSKQPQDGVVKKKKAARKK